ncbi:zinc transporter [Clostridium sp. AWRP]|uniref:zinc transporter n=1 Tax=Clostridium sp. AWRP TaxID=2212991 RepID=UPI000FD7E030|nr:zinc transporter [Clostridium sp. AWRP]AZV58443.1 zinc transporter [Clostridium sp. AWRP]
MNNEHECYHHHDDTPHTHEHYHDGVAHTHTHVHDDDHHHTHEMLDGDESKEEKTLKILLGHWVEHNKSHEEGFAEWVEKSKNMGKVETSQFIEKAIGFMKQADNMLEEAEKHME